MQQDPSPTVAEDPVASARARVEALCRQLAGRGPAPRLIETHISWVVLHGDLAYKFKKPLQLPFLDWRLLAARQRDCAEELRLNARLAPALYLDCVPLVQGPDGPALGGEGPVLDVALRMRRFPDGALWRERLAAGRLPPEEVDALAARLARFHAQAAVSAPASMHGGAALQRRIVADLVRPLDDWCAGPAGAGLEADWARLRGWLQQQIDTLAPLWEQRRAQGRVREGHGDLHLANLLTLQDEGPTAFDALEFDAEMRCIDVLHDLAFPVMDLLAHGAPALAWRLLDGYLADSGDIAGLPALRFYLVCRALVRARVAVLAAPPPGTPDTAGYLRLACALALAPQPRLAITAGLPGAGKSFVARALLQHAGAVRVRSDVERKRLHGLAALQSSAQVPGGIYDRLSTQRTYARLLELAGAVLDAGWPVVVDAAFLRADERAAFAALAAQRRVPFALLWCTAPEAVLRARIAARQARGDDASEADTAVLERLLAAAEPARADEQPHVLEVMADRPLDIAGLDARWRALSVA